MSDDRAPGVIWCLRPDLEPPYVRTADNDQIVILGPSDVGTPSIIRISRKDARLLAKRINQCLDATVKR